jgi:hypothetical protein
MSSMKVKPYVTLGGEEKRDKVIGGCTYRFPNIDDNMRLKC